MSHTVPTQHPAIGLSSHDQRLRALLAIAVAVIAGLTVAVVVLATSSDHLSSTTLSATRANPSAEIGAKLDHSGRKAIIAQTTNRLANYPDAPPTTSTPLQSDRLANYPDAPPSASTPLESDRLANYPDAPPSASTPQQSVRYYLDAPQP